MSTKKQVSKKQESEINLKRTKPKTIKLLYNMMYNITQIFDNNNLEYWASGGTFLGVVRHKGIIPWDDDCDLCVPNRKQFLELVPQLNKCGFVISKIDFGYKILYKNIPIPPGQTFSFPNVDIFLMKLVENGKKPYYTCKYKDAIELWPNEKYYLNEHYPLKKYQFGAGFIYGSNKFKPYLDRMYKPTWNKIAYREYDHETGESIDKVITKLTKSDRVPATPIPKYTIKMCSTKIFGFPYTKIYGK